MKKLLLCFAAAAMLVGCKAKDVEIRVSTDEIQSAIEGDDTSIRFIARFESFGSLDDEKRGQLDSIQKITEAHLSIDDYNLVSTDSKVTITVEGEIPVIIGEPGTGDDAFGLYV